MRACASVELQYGRDGNVVACRAVILISAILSCSRWIGGSRGQ
jgi:hypothetical protein